MVTVGTLKKHLTTCKFALIPCPKECKGEDTKVIRQLMRKDVKIHLKNDCPNRDDECEYCGMKGTHAKIKVHDEICKKKISPCSNVECKKKIRRSYMDKHVNHHCEYTMVPCKYESIGCSKRMIRKDIKEHEEDDDKAHLHMALGVLKDKVIPVLMKEVMPVLTNDTLVPVLKHGTSMTFKLVPFTSKKDKDAIIYSPSFYSSPGGYHLVIRVDANGNGVGKGTHVSIFCAVKKGQYDDELKRSFHGKVIWTLLNQLHDEKHHTAYADFKNLEPDDPYLKPGGCGRGKLKFIPHSMLTHNSENGTQYLKDDTLYFRVSVDMPEHKPWLECAVKH